MTCSMHFLTTYPAGQKRADCLHKEHDQIYGTSFPDIANMQIIYGGLKFSISILINFLEFNVFITS